MLPPRLYHRKGGDGLADIKKRCLSLTRPESPQPSGPELLGKFSVVACASYILTTSGELASSTFTS